MFKKYREFLTKFKIDKKNLFLAVLFTIFFHFPLFRVEAQALPVVIISVETTAVSTGALFSVTASGLSTTTANNLFTFTPVSGGDSVSLPPTSNSVVDASRGVRRISVRVPTSLPVDQTSVTITNTENGQFVTTLIYVVSISLDITSARVGDVLNVRITKTGDPASAPFVQGQTRVTLGAGITILSVTVESPTSLLASVTVSSVATPAFRTASVTVPRGSFLLMNAFNVLPLLPTCSSAGPDGDTTTLNSGTKRVFAYGVSGATEVWFPTNSDTHPYNPLVVDQPKDSSSNLDDLVWYPGVNDGDGTWYADIDLANHPGLGEILVSAQLVNSASETVLCDTANFVRTIPSNVTLSSGTVSPDHTTQYNIIVSGTDEHGADKITAAQAVVNYEPGFGSGLRGFVSWYGPSDIYEGFQDRQCCSLNGVAPASCAPTTNPLGGGFAAVQPSGSEYIHLDSCDVVDSGNTRSVNFTVRFAPAFTSPLSGNDIFGFVETSTCCKVGYTFQQNDGYETGYINFDTNFSLDIPTPDVPTISGPVSSYVNQGTSYGFNSLDPSGVRYGVDWKKIDGTPYVSTDTMDGVADVWLPESGLVPSGTTLNTDLMWTTVGNKIFQALAQNLYGVNSAWSGAYPILIAATPVPGVCGPAAVVYPEGSSSYAGAYCADGTPSDTPSFPSPGSSVSWTCLGLEGGADSPLCTATLVDTTRTVSINIIPVGGYVISSPGGINCGGGGITCSDTYGDGEIVVLTAIPKSSYWKFAGWSGSSCSGLFPTCVFTVDGPEDATATFDLRAFGYKEF